MKVNPALVASSVACCCATISFRCGPMLPKELLHSTMRSLPPVLRIRKASCKISGFLSYAKRVFGIMTISFELLSSVVPWGDSMFA